MIPILEVESCKNELAARKANFTHHLPVSTKIQTFKVEISKKISVIPTEVPNRNVFLAVTNGILSNYSQLRNGHPLKVLKTQNKIYIKDHSTGLITLVGTII
jgi:hypothetical protein